MDLPLDWNNIFNSDVRTQGVHAESIPDALIMSLNTLGKVDTEYISSVTGADYKTVISTLKGSIYQNPLTWNECFYQGWETAEEYLSGNLMRKWNTNRIKRGKRSGAQKCLKKASCRKVRHLHTETLSPKGNHYRRVFDYWWTWL